jgi:glutamate carboxypeptidase
VDGNHSQKLQDYLSKDMVPMVAFLRRLVEAESPSLVPDSQATVLTILLEALQELDFDVRLIAGRKTGGHLLAKRKSQTAPDGSQLLLGHCDTVWPLGTIKEMAFLIEGNIIRGPGVFDMKGGLTQMIFALKAIRELDLQSQLEPVVFINSDEEIGSIESSSYIHQLARAAERVFVLEPALGLDGKLKTARKGVGRFEINVTGRAAHAGLEPEKGISAILELSYLIQRLNDMNDIERGISVNVGMVEGGTRPNVVAPNSRAVVDVRVPIMSDAQQIEMAIFGLQPSTPGISLDIHGGINRPPLERTEANGKIWRLAKIHGEALGLHLEEAMAGGGSDGNITSQFTATLDGLGSVGDGAHATHEFIFADKMIERSTLLALLMLAPPIN